MEESARFFVDENDLALGKALAEEHEGVVYPGHSAIPEVPRQAQDDEWLETIGEHGLVVITRDQRIRYRPVEKQAWIDHAVRGFVLTGRKSQSTAQSQAILNSHWRRIERLIDERPEGPWMYAVTESGLREIELEQG